MWLAVRANRAGAWRPACRIDETPFYDAVGRTDDGTQQALPPGGRVVDRPAASWLYESLGRVIERWPSK